MGFSGVWELDQEATFCTYEYMNVLERVHGFHQVLKGVPLPQRERAPIWPVMCNLSTDQKGPENLLAISEVEVWV